jgi:protein ImuB
VVVRRFGPHRISGGWWARTVERDYWYVETQRGDLLWIFYDRPRRRWFLHAEVD